VRKKLILKQFALTHSPSLLELNVMTRIQRLPMINVPLLDNAKELLLLPPVRSLQLLTSLRLLQFLEPASTLKAQCASSSVPLASF